MKKRLKTIALIVIPLLILMILGIFVLGVGGGVLGYFTGILYIATAINHQTGLNIWLARLIAIPFVVAGYYYGLRLILFHKKKRKIGYLTVIAVLSVICVSMFATQGSFSRKTGEALKYYFTDDRGQIVLRDHGGTDADTGAKLQKVTPELMAQYRLQQEGILKVTDTTLFDPNTGEPLKRYYQDENGSITLFPLEVQFHPQYGTKLEIITSEIAVRFSKQADTSSQFSNTEEAPRPVSLVAEEPVRETTSPEEIQRLNQEYQNKVQGQLDAAHAEQEQESQQNFGEALNDASARQETSQ